MNKKLVSLSTILSIKIYESLTKVQYFKNQKSSLSQELSNIQERIQLNIHLRKEQFLSRNNIEHYNSLLDHLQTLRLSIYNQYNVSCKSLQSHQSNSLQLINKRKVIEKILKTKYSSIKR